MLANFLYSSGLQGSECMSGFNAKDIKQLTELSLDRKLSLGGALATAAAGIASYGLSGGGTMTYAILAFGSAITLTADKVARFDFEEKVKAYFKKISSDEKALRCIGNCADALMWLRKDGRKIHSVLNTVFTRRGYDGHADIADEDTKAFFKYAAGVLADGAKWRDIYTPSQRESIDEFAAIPPAKQSDRYEAYELPSDFPIMQCLILTFKGATTSRAVLYGWSYQTSNPGKELVYLSEDSDVVDFFAGHMQELLKKSNRTTLTPKSGVSANPNLWTPSTS